MRIAVLFNPGAGNDGGYRKIGELLSKGISGHSVYTFKGYCGEHYLKDGQVLSGRLPREYKAGVKYMARLLASTDPELFICVGGDGLAAYVADALITGDYDIPIMGIAGGTANVGPIVTVKPESLEEFDPSMLNFVSVGAIDVTSGSKHIGYGFNDVVIGNTFLGTMAEKTVNILVESIVKEDKKVIETPASDIVTEKFMIKKNDNIIKHKILKPAQIIVSPLEVDDFYGRAITGALCKSASSPFKAALALLEHVVIKAEVDNRGVDSFMQVEHMIFTKDDIVSISGLSSKGHIIIDGNPYLREEENIYFKYIPNIIKVAKPVI